MNDWKWWIGSNERAQSDLGETFIWGLIEEIAKYSKTRAVPQRLGAINLEAHRYIEISNAVRELPRKAPKHRAVLFESENKIRLMVQELKEQTGLDITNEETWDSDTI